MTKKILVALMGLGLLNCGDTKTTLKGTALLSSSEDPQADTRGDVVEPRPNTPPVQIEMISFSMDTLGRDMNTVNSNRWSPSFLPGFGSDEVVGLNRYAFVASGIRSADGNAWERKYLDSSFNLAQTDMVRFVPRFSVNDALQARNNAPNTRVQIRDCNRLTLTTTGTWVVQNNLLSDAAQTYGNWHGGASRYQPIVMGKDAAWKKRDESANGGGSSYGWIGYGKMVSGVTTNPYLYDGWSLNLDNMDLSVDRTLSDLTQNVVGHVIYCQARLILHDATKVDDRAEAHIIMNASADYYNVSKGNSYIGEAFHGRFKAVTNDWQAFTASDIPEARLLANPPPRFN